MMRMLCIIFWRRNMVVSRCVFTVTCSALLLGCSSGSALSSSTEETLLTVSSDASCDTATSICTIDQAITQAQSYDNPVVVLPEGTHTLSESIGGALTFRAADYSTSSTSVAAEKVAVTTRCVSDQVTLSDSAVVLARDSDDAVLQVAMPAASTALVLEGVQVNAATGQAALAVTKGSVTARSSQLFGRVSLSGADATLSVSNVVLRPEAMTESAGIDVAAAQLSGDQLYLQDESCALALVQVTDGASFSADYLEVTAHEGLGLCVHNATANLCNGRIHDISLIEGTHYGRGVHVVNGGSATLAGTRVDTVHEAGIVVDGHNTTCTLSNVIVDSIARSASMEASAAVVVQNGGALTVTDAATFSNIESGPGIYLTANASATIQDSTIEDVVDVGVYAKSSDLTFANSEILRTTTLNTSGAAIYIDPDGAQPTIDISDALLDSNQSVGVYVESDGATITIDNTSIQNTTAYVDGIFTFYGNAIFAQNVCSGLTVTDGHFASQAGPHIFLLGANASLNSSAFTSNSTRDFEQSDCNQACVTPLTQAAMFAAGYDSSHVLALCPGSSSPSVEAFEFDLYHVLAGS